MAEAGAEGSESPADPTTEPAYIDFDFDALLAPGEVPAVLRDEPSTPASAPAPAASEESHLYGIGEDLVRLRRQLELRKAEAEILTQLQGEADSPATRDLIEAAFAAGYFAGKGELERRIGHAR